MQPGDIVLTKKIRCYAPKRRIIVPGTPEYNLSSAPPDQFIAMMCLGTLPRDVDPKTLGPMASQQLTVIGYVPREGYPNPDRFKHDEFNAACVETAQVVLDKAPACMHCKKGRPKVTDDVTVGPQIKCSECGSTVTLEMYTEFPNSIEYAMHATQAWMAACVAVAQAQ